MVGKTITVSESVFQGLKEGKLKGVIPGGNPSQRIEHLLGLPQKVRELENKLVIAEEGLEILKRDNRNLRQRNAELEEAKTNILAAAPKVQVAKYQKETEGIRADAMKFKAKKGKEIAAIQAYRDLLKASGTIKDYDERMDKVKGTLDALGFNQKQIEGPKGEGARK